MAEDKPRVVDDPSKYVVIAPYITLKTMTINGPAILGFHRGSPVPPDADPEVIARMEDDHMVARAEHPEKLPSLSPSPQEEQDIAAEGKHPQVEMHRRVDEAQGNLPEEGKPRRGRRAVPSGAEPNAPAPDAAGQDKPKADAPKGYGGAPKAAGEQPKPAGA